MAPIETRLCSELGIEYPIVQAPIGSVSTPALAAAVSEAGGFGTLAVTWRDPDETARVIAETAAATDQPFGVNLVLDEATTPRPPAELLDVVLDSPADAVSFSFGDPTPYLDRCAAAGVTTIVTVGSPEMAREAVDAGADVIVAQGWEAGGHLQSDVATLPLVPRVVDAVPDTPVVAAGGIADGRGVAAALALGADGAWLGTRFVATEEADAHPRYKQAVVSGDTTETRRSSLFDGGWPDREHRTLATETVREWEAAGEPAAGERPGEGETVAETPDGDAIERYDDTPPLSDTTGDVDALPQYVGQSVGNCESVVPASTVVDRLVEETTEAMERGADCIGDAEP